MSTQLQPTAARSRMTGAVVISLITAILATILLTASPASAATKTVKCESWSNAYRTCETGSHITGISVKTQHSSTTCRNGSTYGTTGSKIWVNKGCRATFNVTHNATAPPASPVPGAKSVKCESWNNAYRTCETGSTIKAISVKTQHSSTTCRNGSTYGTTGSKIWVNKGCRATFNVTHNGTTNLNWNQSSKHEIAILGDSYISGEGIIDNSTMYEQNPTGLTGDLPRWGRNNVQCAQNAQAYGPRRVAELGHTLRMLACSGDKIAELEKHQIGKMSGSEKYVFLSIGGNDVGFSNKLECMLYYWGCWTTSDRRDLDNRLDELYLDGRGKLVDTYKKVLDGAGQNATLYVSTYPLVLEADEGWWFDDWDCDNLAAFSGDGARWADVYNKEMNNRIKAAARTVNGYDGHSVQIIDLENSIDGACQNSTDIRTLEISRKKSLFHPTWQGHNDMLRVVRSATAAIPDIN